MFSKSSLRFRVHARVTTPCDCPDQLTSELMVLSSVRRFGFPIPRWCPRQVRTLRFLTQSVAAAMFQICRLMQRGKIQDTTPEPTGRVQAFAVAALYFFRPALALRPFQLSCVRSPDDAGHQAGNPDCLHLRPPD